MEEQVEQNNSEAMNSSNNDLATARFYDHYAEQGMVDSEASQSAISKYFDFTFARGDKVLDIGSGSGRDLAVLLNGGVDAYGIEPNESMRAYCTRRHPTLITRVRPGLLPLDDAPFGGDFDGVLCSAVLMHIPEDQLEKALSSIVGVLKPKARLLFSLPCLGTGLLQNGRDRDGRLFSNHSPHVIESTLYSLGFARIDLGEKAISDFTDITWTIYLFERLSKDQ